MAHSFDVHRGRKKSKEVSSEEEEAREYLSFSFPTAVLGYIPCRTPSAVSRRRSGYMSTASSREAHKLVILPGGRSPFFSAVERHVLGGQQTGH